MRFLYVFLFVCSFALHSAEETVLGQPKIIKISQKVSIQDCQASFKKTDYSSFCKVQVWKQKDTDLLASQSESVIEKISFSNNSTLRINLATNTEGFYWFIFERKDKDGMLLPAVTFEEASPYMQGLIDKLANGEVFWKVYRLAE